MPPPSSGGIVLRQLLGASETLGMEASAWRSADELHLFVEAARRAFADRNQLVGDPDFVTVPTATLLDPAYIARRMADVDRARATPSTAVHPGLDPTSPVGPAKQESPDTTHFSVVDAEGNAVANTTTLNTSYGSLYVLGSSGVLLNNEMDDFTVKPGTPNAYGLVQGAANAIAPGKRMLSSMTPTIVVRDGELRAVLGSPGGPTISTTVAQLVRALVDYGRPLDEAVPAFRAHHQWWPDEILVESTIPASTQAELERRGHRVRKRERIGHVNGVEVEPESHGLRAVSDTTRGGGKAAAY
jgi:gamma-glutamyltranspeptidase/glutathione hydrolase